ncbi:hypothetical protein GE115_01460 [Agromyces sp. CFH 90414]|uniref:PH domain-containing protein n=1 Tax=Agromyces agglutinans TaxID=2662258 RepID=A0A6I2FBJ7_9MICO|nr:hypothetical protein [Agromyces agglutinans]MRG58548.1 hypothetical protein [Agromyces agglutinans]
MAEAIGILVAVVIVGGAGFLMWRSWRRRTERDSVMRAYPVPERLGEAVVSAEVLYVATTPVGRPLERLAVQGLAFRGSGHVEVHPEGVVLRIAGEQPSFFPAARLVGAGTASFAIDRGVEPEGLVAITWIVDESEPAELPTHVDSTLRARYPGDAGRIIAAVTDIAAAHITLRPDAESETEA